MKHGPWIVAGSVLMVILLLAILSRASGGVTRTVPAATVDAATILLRGANKWAATSDQDGNELVSLINITYAHAYMGALRTLLSDREILQHADVDARELEQEFERKQVDAIARVSVKCPAVRPEGEFAVNAGWLG